MLGRGEIRSAQGHVFCGSAFARYVHVLKENTMISGALKLRKIAFSVFVSKKKKKANARISEALGFRKIFVQKKNGKFENVTKKRKNGKK